MDNMTAATTAQRAANSDFLEKLARVGFVIYGVVHLLVGVTATQLAFGGNGQADESGAMATLAETGFGKVVLWAGAVGFAALSLWWLIEAIAGSRGPGGARQLGDTVKNVGKAILFAAFAFLSLRFAIGSGGGGQGQESATATVLEWPGGRFIVGAVGVGIAAVGVYHVYKGVTRKFLDDLYSAADSGTSGTAITALGVFGYSAMGVAIILVGALFVVAAMEHDPEEAGGMDEALKSLQDQPFGPWLLLIIAVGIAAYGIYCFARARYQRG
jgi:succinate dehydrogenase/fumarate reductase cytochrome b subunit